MHSSHHLWILWVLSNKDQYESDKKVLLISALCVGYISWVFMKIFMALFSIAIPFVTLFIAVLEKINAKRFFLNDGKILFSILSNVICEMSTLPISRKYEKSIGITQPLGWKTLKSLIRLLPTIMPLITQVLLKFKTFYSPNYILTIVNLS